MLDSSIRHSVEPTDGQEAQVHYCCYSESRFPVSVNLMNFMEKLTNKNPIVQVPQQSFAPSTSTASWHPSTTSGVSQTS